MIASLRGTVQAVVGATVVLEVGGVGYAVLVTPDHASRLRVGTDAFLHTALIVRDDELSLCGFETREGLEVFDLLRGVSGVGPKSSLGVLAQLTPAQIAAAVAAEDDAAFRKVSGIGPKTAKLITISLQGKLSHLVTADGEGARPGPAVGGAQAETVTALIGLGFQERRAIETVEELAAASPEAGAAALLRLALAALGPSATTGSARR
ncbi:MAG TPA: Holliday junction branch migration protein RuvA [Microbacteriaceae bacterium]|nr:Holliday junction branch migration protein RuvA [Microbacteriaceae bacterium]